MKLLIAISILAAALQIAPVAYSQGGGRQRGGGAGGGGGQMGSLTPEERQKVMNARRQAMNDPSVSSAREKAQAAQKEFKEALDAAMLKVDPSLKPILDKMPKGHEHARGGGGGEPEG
jgi:Spy/CpxP family protein refolding chaperone